MVTIIGVCGKKFNGKDTIADYLVNRYQFTKISVGDPLKYGIQQMFGFSNEQLWGSKKETVDPFWKVTPREILQYIGTDCFRMKFGQDFPNIGENIWAMSLERKIESLLQRGIHKIVVPDIRFPNEEKVIRKFNGNIINVIRHNFINQDTHISENSLDQIKVDFHIENTTFDELYARIDDIMPSVSVIKNIQLE